jgi:hypothetical protein
MYAASHDFSGMCSMTNSIDHSFRQPMHLGAVVEDSMRKRLVQAGQAEN